MIKARVFAASIFLAVCSQTAFAKAPPVSGYITLPVVVVTQKQLDEKMEKLKGRPVLDLGQVKLPATQHPGHHPKRGGGKGFCKNYLPEECEAIFDIKCEYGCGVCVRGR